MHIRVRCTFRESGSPVVMAKGARLGVRGAAIGRLSSRRRGSAGPLSVVGVVRSGDMIAIVAAPEHVFCANGTTRARWKRAIHTIDTL